MKLSASNIGWKAEQDDQVLRCMMEHGFLGLEIAPSRVFPVNPYEDLLSASAWAQGIKVNYGLEICSMQSIWYGKTQRIVESAESRQYLLDYTKKSICFADAVGCKNLVFGCPRNRTTDTVDDVPILEDFLWHCAEEARPYDVVIALEPNPPIYRTNYINTTAQAIDLLKRLNHPSLRLNLDLGTVIENGESLDWIEKDGYLIHHVHISEPGLVPIQKRIRHDALMKHLTRVGYTGFVSIEMGANGNEIYQAVKYIGDVL